jgi:hypothetical protein
MKTVYVVYQAYDGTESCVFPADSEQYHLLSHTVDDVPMELIGMYSAGDPWEHGFELGNAILGFGPDIKHGSHTPDEAFR